MVSPKAFPITTSREREQDGAHMVRGGAHAATFHYNSEKDGAEDGAQRCARNKTRTYEHQWFGNTFQTVGTVGTGTNGLGTHFKPAVRPKHTHAR